MRFRETLKGMGADFILPRSLATENTERRIGRTLDPFGKWPQIEMPKARDGAAARYIYLSSNSSRRRCNGMCPRQSSDAVKRLTGRRTPRPLPFVRAVQLYSIRSVVEYVYRRSYQDASIPGSSTSTIPSCYTLVNAVTIVAPCKCSCSPP